MNYKRIKKREGGVFYHSCLKIVKIIIVFWLIGVGNVYSKTDESQQNPLVVTGTIKDKAGDPMIGVSVSVLGKTDVGTITDVNGKYQITVPADGSLLISYIGYKKETIPVRNRTSIDIVLEEDAQLIDEVVVVGYGTQKKTTLSGAVSSIKGAEVITTKNENVQNMITGKIPGVRVWQRSSEPGAFNNEMDIRGMGTPLVIIDGIPRSMDVFKRLDSNDIEDISVLKDASAAIYGVRAANGVVLVTTKKGQVGKPAELTYSGSFTFQKPSGLPETFDIYQWMTIRNEHGMHNYNGGSIVFDEEAFNEYRNGTKKGTDWYKAVFHNYAPQTQHNVTVTGGTEKTTYHVGLGYQYQEGFFKTSSLKYDKYNVRANLSSKVTNRLTFDLNTNLVLDSKNEPNAQPVDLPGQNVWNIFKRYWRQGPHIPVWADPEETLLNYGIIEGDNIVAWTDSDILGYMKYDKRWIETSASLKYDIPGIKGLSIKELFSYDYQMDDNSRYRKSYNLYTYNTSTETYDARTLNTPMSFRKENFQKMQWLSQSILNYNNVFGNHSVGGTLVWEVQKKEGTNFYSQRNLPVELDQLFAGLATDQLASMYTGNNDIYRNANMGLAGRFNYAFSSKYLLELLFRYDGSSKFAPGSTQWGFFPSASVGWRISEEDFFKNSALSFMQQLKLRASYGVVGDDNAVAYQFISGYNYPPEPAKNENNRRYRADGYMFGGNYITAAQNKGITNPDITWFTAKTFDIGVDMEAWKGLFGVTVDYYSRHREGLLAKRTGGIPTVVGATLPDENLNSDQTFGLELTLSHRNKINDFTYRALAQAWVTRVKNLDVERAPNGNSWDNWRNNTSNRMTGRYLGYGANGQFSSWDEIMYSPIRIINNTLIGDYRLEDWNGDGEINDLDRYFVLYNTNSTPFLNFSLNLNAAWKGFDLNVLLQGSALCTVLYGERFMGAGGGNDNSMTQFWDRWHPVDPKADPYDPATQWVSGYYAYTGSNMNINSAFAAVNGAYLRLKSIELGYTIPHVVKSIKNLRVFVNAYDILTLTKVRDVDPEHPESSYGYLYPLNKTLSFGLNLTF